ncbi:MAG: cytochrome c4 [Wenzhouxiangella sp.]|nr:cytochrome c4 [Wenzhouxiangella sp.]MCH8477966.1 cytochrome c4 [Wenzhouxiangella sp.]
MARIVVMLLALAPLMALAIGNPEAGEQKAASCAACHGPDGNSPVSIWPKLAEQHADYTARQTRMVRDGLRDVPEMIPFVMNLTDQDIADIAAFYEQQSIEPGVADEDLVALGRKIYHDGNRETGVPACAACHGPAGMGIPGAHYPMVRAQHADYSADRLRRYRAGEHNGDDDMYSLIMVGVAARLTDEEIDAVSSYMEGLHVARWPTTAGN